MSVPRILTIDIETMPNLAVVFDIWNQNISTKQILELGHVTSFAAKWHDQDKVMFYSEHHHGHDVMIRKAHALLDKADIVVHYNGKRFDMKHLRREFALAGLTRYSPVKEIDLLHTVRREFDFVSNKLGFVAEQFGLGSKVQHEGIELWIACMRGDRQAWATMREYNKHDVVLTEALYDRVRPWIANHPHMGLWSGEDCCPNCGGTHLQRRGPQVTLTRTYQRLQCKSCGKWCQSTRSIGSVGVKAAA